MAKHKLVVYEHDESGKDACLAMGDEVFHFKAKVVE